MPALDLVDQDGKTVTERDFRGKLMLVFFGFTHCPDICPVTVKNLSSLMEILGDKAAQLAPIFITVDPARDTPAAMKEYLSNFDSRIVGLTGDMEQIKQVAAAYKVYYAKSARKDAKEPDAPEAQEHVHAAHGDDHADGDYQVDHSGYIYLMDKDGNYVTHFPFDANPMALMEALNPYLL